MFVALYAVIREPGERKSIPQCVFRYPLPQGVATTLGIGVNTGIGAH